MKVKIIGLLALFLVLSCTKDENVIEETNLTTTLEVVSSIENFTTSETTQEKGKEQEAGCYNVYFDAALITADEIPVIKESYFNSNLLWYTATIQPEDYPHHQIWCLSTGRPGGSESENPDDHPDGITFVPIK